MAEIGEILFADYKSVKKFKCDRKSLELLLYLKDEKPLSQVSDILGMTVSEAELIIKNFISAGVLLADEKVKSSDFDYSGEKGTPSENVSVPSEKKSLNSTVFFENINIQLASAIGPIAEVILEDCVIDMGETIGSFPVSRMAELVNFLSREIPRSDKKNKFQREMMNYLKKYH